LRVELGALLGALAFIGKPFDLTYLTRIVNKALKDEALERANIGFRMR